MNIWWRVVIALAFASGLAYSNSALAQSKECGPKGCPTTTFNDGKPTQTLQTISVTGYRINLVSPFQSYSALTPELNFGLGNTHGNGEFVSANYSPVVNPKNDRNNQVGCKQDTVGEPIEISTQTKTESLPFFALPGEMGLSYTLYYNSSRGRWYDNLNYSLDDSCGGADHCRQVVVTRPDGSTLKFQGDSYSTYGNFPEIGGGGLATLNHNTDGTYTLHDEDATTQVYGTYGLQSITDASGIGWTISYDPATATRRVSHTSGRSFTIAMQYVYTNGLMSSINVTVTDPAGNAYRYTETPSFLVTSVTLPASPSTVIGYKYDASNRLTEVDYNGVPHDYTSYAPLSTRLADGSDAVSIAYSYPASGQMTATITNPLGHTTTKQYTMFTDPSGAGGQYLLTSTSENAVSDCGSTVSSVAYDSNGYLTKTVDNNGVTHTYSYAANGQLQTETEAYGTSIARKTDYVWDPDQQLNRLLSVTVEGESGTSYTYTQNRLASVTRTDLTSVGGTNSLTTSYEYTLYTNGMVKTMVVIAPSPNDTAELITNYDKLGNVTSVEDGLGHTTTYSNYNGLGEPGKVVGPNGDETDYTYDARGRVATKTTHPYSTPSNPAGVPLTWTYTYDGFGLLAQASVNYGGGGTTTWTRDAEMRVTQITHSDQDGTSTESFAYDANGDVTSDVTARGSDMGKSTTYVYDGLGRVDQRKGANGQVLTYAYDGNGNVVSVTDALGHKTSYQYDALNRVTKMVDANGGITQYAYDAGDHLTQVIDPRGLVTTYSYDGLGLLWKQVSPDTGTTTFTYDAYGRLSNKVRADGIPDYIGYDALNRVISTGTSAYGSQSFTYDSCTNGKGRLCSVSDGHTTTSYSYSPEGWIQGRGFTVDGTTYSVGYSYDSLNRPSIVVYPDGNRATYHYHNDTVSEVDLTVGTYNVVGVSNIHYRPMDAAMSSWTSYNGLVNTINYDQDLRPTSISVPGVQSLSFAYDAADRITKITNGMDATMTETLGYDALSRLTSVVSGADNESFAYDADGNRLTANINGVAWTYTPASNSNRLTGASSSAWSGSYSYDAQGNMLGTAHQYWAYDSFGRMRTATPYSGSPVTTYDVNPEGQRLRKYTSTTSTYFAPDVGGKLLAEDINGTWYDYVWLNGRLVEVIANGGVFSLHDDQTGRPQVLTEPNGTSIDWAAQNKPFDRTVTTNAWGPFNIGFPGQYNDTEVGDYWYNGARDYSPGLGRYLESDPIGLGGGVNTYVYGGSDPITNIDPFGLAYQVSLNVGLTVVTPWVGINLNVSSGINFDGWNTRTFEQVQANTGIDSHGFYVGAGPGISFGKADPLNAIGSTSSAPYFEADAADFYGAGFSATKDKCGSIDWDLGKGLKASIGAGIGGFSGTSYSATFASPPVGLGLGH